MKDHIEIGQLTKYDAFRVNRDQVVDLEIWFKIHTNVSSFEFYDNCKIPSFTNYLKEAEIKITIKM